MLWRRPEFWESGRRRQGAAKALEPKQGALEAQGEALVVGERGVERMPDVVDRERGQLHHPVHQEAHGVHQVRLERRVGCLLVSLREEEKMHSCLASVQRGMIFSSVS